MTLRKMLAGKSVRVQPSVGTRSQSISGGVSVKDMETLFQLVHLYFTQPRRDTVAFQSLINRTHAFLTNRNASPKVDYNDSIRAILYDHHPRLKPVTQETLMKADYDRILQIYKERFSDASGFKAVVIGNYDEQQLKDLMCQYLATLPATHKGEQTNWANVPRIVEGDFVSTFKKKMATPLANVSIYYTADVPFTPQSDLELDFLTRVLKIAYTDSVREEKGGTYGVSVSGSMSKDPREEAIMRINFRTDPAKYDELIPIIYQCLDDMAKNGPTQENLNKIKEYERKTYGQMKVINNYYDYLIYNYLTDGIDFDTDYVKKVDSLTIESIRDFAKRIFSPGNHVEITMQPEK
jgi:zinc protease